jgi:hypothetical protein
VILTYAFGEDVSYREIDYQTDGVMGKKTIASAAKDIFLKLLLRMMQP